MYFSTLKFQEFEARVLIQSNLPTQYYNSEIRRLMILKAEHNKIKSLLRDYFLGFPNYSV